MTGSEMGAGAAVGAGAAKGIGGIATGIIAAVVIGGGVFAYVQYGGSAPAPAPEEALSSLFGVPAEAKTSEEHATFNVKISNSELGQAVGVDASEPVFLKGTVDAKTDITERNKMDASFDIAAVLSDEAESNKLSATINVILLDGGEKLYMKMVLPPIFPGVAPFNNKWIEMSPDEMAALYGVPAPEMGVADFEKTQALLTKFKESGIVKITKSLGSDSVNGVAANRYAYEIDITALPKLLPEIAKLQGQEMTEAQIAMMNEEWKEVEKVFAGTTLGGEVWISKADPRSVRMTFATSLKKSADIPADVDLTVEQTEVSYNKPVTITAPEGAVTMEALMQSMYGGLDNGAMMEGM